MMGRWRRGRPDTTPAPGPRAEPGRGCPDHLGVGEIGEPATDVVASAGHAEPSCTSHRLATFSRFQRFLHPSGSMTRTIRGRRPGGWLTNRNPRTAGAAYAHSTPRSAVRALGHSSWFELVECMWIVTDCAERAGGLGADTANDTESGTARTIGLGGSAPCPHHSGQVRR